MSWTLGSTTLPDPKTFSRQYVEKATFHEMVNGTSKRDITSRKEKFFLGYTRLTQAIVASVLAEYAQKQSLMFSVTDGDLSIAEREVHVLVSGREYQTKGSEFRENFQLILEDVNSSL